MQHWNCRFDLKLFFQVLISLYRTSVHSTWAQHPVKYFLTAPICVTRCQVCFFQPFLWKQSNAIVSASPLRTGGSHLLKNSHGADPRGEQWPCDYAWRGSLRALADRSLTLWGRKRFGIVSFLLHSVKQSAFVTGLVPVSLTLSLFSPPKWNNLQDLEFFTNYSGLKG